jgi:hypothetical protein
MDNGKTLWFQNTSCLKLCGVKGLSELLLFHDRHVFLHFVLCQKMWVAYCLQLFCCIVNTVTDETIFCLLLAVIACTSSSWWWLSVTCISHCLPWVCVNGSISSNQRTLSFQLSRARLCVCVRACVRACVCLGGWVGGGVKTCGLLLTNFIQPSHNCICMTAMKAGQFVKRVSIPGRGSFLSCSRPERIWGPA